MATDTYNPFERIKRIKEERNTALKRTKKCGIMIVVGMYPIVNEFRFILHEGCRNTA